MKCLFLSNAQENSGYSHAAENYIRSLMTTDIDLVIRPINMIGNPRKLSDDILALENKDLKNIDVVIQHNLPSTFSYKGGVENVGHFCSETHGYKKSGWIDNLMLMDKVIVYCSEQRDMLMRDHKQFSNKTHIVYPAIDISAADKQYPKPPFSEMKGIKFYTISEFTKRKNVPAILIAYFSTFDVHDDVLLVLKVNGISRDQLKGVVEETKKGCNRFSNLQLYPKVALMTDYLSDDELNGIHQHCDCFISASHGEASCLPSINSFLYANKVIANNSSAFKDHAKLGFDIDLVASHPSNVFGQDGPRGLFTTDEYWDSIDVANLGIKMRNYYNQYINLNDRKIVNNKELAKKLFNFQTVGESYKKALS